MIYWIFPKYFRDLIELILTNEAFIESPSHGCFEVNVIHFTVLRLAFISIHSPVRTWKPYYNRKIELLWRCQCAHLCKFIKSWITSGTSCKVCTYGARRSLRQKRLKGLWCNVKVICLCISLSLPHPPDGKGFLQICLGSGQAKGRAWAWHHHRHLSLEVWDQQVLCHHHWCPRTQGLHQEHDHWDFSGIGRMGRRVENKKTQ